MDHGIQYRWKEVKIAINGKDKRSVSGNLKLHGDSNCKRSRWEGGCAQRVRYLNLQIQKWTILMISAWWKWSRDESPKRWGSSSSTQCFDSNILIHMRFHLGHSCEGTELYWLISVS